MNEVVASAEKWFDSRGWKAFPFQKEAWEAYVDGKDGIVNAPTGSGKTYSLLVPIVAQGMRDTKKKGLRAIWITPIRALSKEIEISANRLIEGLNADWSVGIRTGDTPTNVRQKQMRRMPEILITTPESLHLLLASKDHPRIFKHLEAVVVDEWHDLIGSKRGVQVELGLSRLKAFVPNVRIWGISATIGNMDEAKEVLLGTDRTETGVFIRSGIKKDLRMTSLMPEEVEKMPWAGHIGLKLLDKVAKIIEENGSTLIFTNTRGQCEIWYQAILDQKPELAGIIAMHHSAISKELRYWVEDALYDGRLKAVVCTSTLDLGVDFRPVDAIVQIGGPKGVARFMQRAGRSGHQPGATSKIYFLPTHSLELIEAAALREAINLEFLENRSPHYRSFDVLIQYLTTLAVGGGFTPDEIEQEVLKTFCFNSMSKEEWQWCLSFITTGGHSLQAYPEYRKIVIEEGTFKVANQRVARRHRMSIGTIVGDTMMKVKYSRGGLIGHVEEYFAASMRPGDAFWFAGRSLEVVKIRELVLEVVNSKKKSGRIASWQGGRLPLTSKMSEMLRQKIDDYASGKLKDPEMIKVKPLLDLQSRRSHTPRSNELLIEQIKTREGYHVFIYPFEGRLVHEGLASLVAYRISLLKPMSFSLAFNDYGFEMLSDQPIPLDEAFDNEIFSTDHLMDDLEASINSAEMARKKFNDIAIISGLVFQGYPGEGVKERHLKASSSLVFDVFSDYDSSNLLLRQAFNEMIDHQLEIERFRMMLKRINSQKLVITHPSKPTPLSFPIMVDRLREKLTSEKISDRIQKMKRAYDED
ncbi:ligase-associated DNA damage response DEXH box helicase [Sanyastnella coralliicola]|uniref:ligase-associated DNA damage response DEXH box helicase n=1 Tax=Sanyastnella coralliicola TaxID=3069118 RepID=UPI0027BA6E27|nr:ligase-associated DNA damage response DEXH box helicase [Longitalea sp. SCSIO 12813]